MPAIEYVASQDRISGMTNPGMHMEAVTPHDTNELTYFTRGIYVGVTGDVAVIGKNDTVAVTFVGLAAGMIHPIQAKIIKSTGTTATSIVGVY